MEVFAFVLSTLVAITPKLRTKGSCMPSLYYVSPENENLEGQTTTTDSSTRRWHRATSVLIMHDPPEMFYEPKDWSHTAVILRRVKGKHGNEVFCLPGGPLRRDESFVDAAVRHLDQQTSIDVCQPENCLHHLFTFPYETEEVKQWIDFMECVFRGDFSMLLDSDTSLRLISLQELEDRLISQSESFAELTHHALKLYFQRQMDLRARRRLLKGYSSADLEHFGLGPGEEKVVLKAQDSDSERTGALEYTMKTDDGQSPRLLQAADVVLIGVSRAGKTPLSLLLSQEKGLKVANIPLVLELAPPSQLFKVDPRRVFCISQQVEHLMHVRKNRLRREIKKKVGKRSTYADPDYVKRDLENAKELSREHGYTIIDITDRAMEEAASLIISKVKERFPDSEIGSVSQHSG